MKPDKLKMFNTLLRILFLTFIFLLTSHNIKAQSNIITFDEQRYKDVSGQLLYRGGPNTLTDTQLGLDFYIAYGSMKITPFNGDYMLYFTPFIGSTADPRGRIVITFNNLQRYVRIDVSTDGTPVQTPAYLRVSYYRSTDPSNPLYYQDGGGNIEYSNDSEGIKMLIVDTHFAENDIEELEFIPLGSPVLHPAPESLIALSGYHNAIPIAWKAHAGSSPQGYNVYRSTTSGGGYQKIVNNLQHSCYRDNVSNNITYYYVVTAVYSDGESNYSVERSAQAQYLGNTSNSNPASSAPTLDGVIGSNEWSNASQTIINYPGGSGNVTLYAMNTNSKLYLAIDDPRDLSLSSGDNFSLFIDSDHNREWPSQGTGHDGMLRFTYDSGINASYCSFYGFWPDQLSTSDWITPSGTQQAVSAASGHIQYEVSIDLNSNILNASPGDIIGMCCFVYNSGNSKFDGLKPSQIESFSSLVDGYAWSYGPFAYMDFSIAESNPTIIVNKPNGEENWQVGTSHDITWNSSNVANTKIEYSTNNGSNWIIIVSSIPSNGSYNWTIPNTPSTNCKVRISDASNASINDQSDYVFTISIVPYIEVVSPNGGENWEVGSSHDIIWRDNSSTNVKIDYSTNSGNDWINIIQSTPSDGYYTWTIPNTPSTNCLVRVIDISNPSVNDQSDKVYTISQLTKVTFSVDMSFVSPAITSNDIVAVRGSISPLEWDKNYNLLKSTNSNIFTNTVEIDNSYNYNDLQYKFIIQKSDGSIIWESNVGSGDSGNRVYNLKPGENNLPVVFFNNVSLMITSPNGGENWQTGTTHNITWSSVNISNVKIDYSTNNGDDWINIISSVSSNGSFSWTIPNTPSASCKVRISDVSNSLASDQSNFVFTINSQPPPPEIIVISPNGGENWEVETSHDIIWSSSSVTNVSIEYSTNNGRNWISIVSSTPSDGSHNWTIPNTPSASCKIKISDASNSSLSDQSNNIFTINSQPPPPEITITSPNGGENWQTGSSHEIRWISSSVANVNIEYSTDNATTWTSIVSSTQSDDSYSWTIPNTPSTNCRVKISDASNSSVSDQSDNLFTISSQPLPPEIKVISPNGGENWQVGSSHDIIWSGSNVANVKIEYSTNNGTNWTGIISSISSDVSYSWTIPNTPSANCKVRISGESNSLVNDESDNLFVIGEVSEQAAEFKNKGDYIEVPNSSTLTSSNFSIEFWLKVKQLGDPNAAGGEQNILDMRGDNNTGFNFRLAGTAFPIALFAIALPGNVNTNNVINQNVWYHIAVTQDNSELKLYLNGGLAGESPNIYNPNTQSSLRIGENLGYPGAYLGLRGDIDELHFWNIVRSQEEIKSDMFAKLNGNEAGLSACWDFNIQNNKVIMDLTSNANNGTLNGNTALVNSDAPVGIVPPVVLSPNGGENWKVDSQQSITWTSTNIDNVKLEYSTNNGRTWTSIIEATTSSGSYPWIIPNTPSSNCRVKISDVSYSLANDISDNAFTIVYPLPSANFDASPSRGLQPLAVNFSDLSTGEITSWVWNFGDGSSGNEKNPVHIYNKTGTFTITLTVTGTGGSNAITRENLIEVDSVKWNIPSTINMSENVTVSAEIPDYFKPTICKLFYRMGGQTTFTATDFNTFNNLLSAEIPPEFSTIRGIEYYIEFFEGENTFTFPQSNPQNRPAVIYVKLPNIIPDISFQSKKYEMVSIPLYLENKVAMNYLIDSYGEYDRKQWRVFRWNNASASYLEYPDIDSELEPGSSFWLITRNGENFKLSNAKSINSSSPFIIKLNKGWNQIGNPFAFPVAWDSIQKKSELLQSPILWNSETEENEPDQNTLVPWKGYWIYNMSDVEQTIGILPSESNGIKKKQIFNNIGPGEFVLQIKAFNLDKTQDIQNYVGMLKNANDEIDKFDIIEPPPVYDKISLAITRNETAYIQNIVSVSSEGAFWDLIIHSNQSDVKLEFEKKSALPEDFKLWFLDKNRMLSLPVIDNRLEFHLPDGGKGFYRLIIGKEEYAKLNSDQIPLIPLEYSLLQNYPNPFNSSTKITYNLREKSQVTFEIFDILGRRVNLLLNNELQNPGRHTFIWNAINSNGEHTSSGIYIYRIRAGDFRDSKMMVQIK